MSEANETLNRNNHQLVQFNPATPTHQWGLFLKFTSHPHHPVGGLLYGSKWGIPPQHPSTACHEALQPLYPSNGVFIVGVNLFMKI